MRATVRRAALTLAAGALTVASLGAGSVSAASAATPTPWAGTLQEAGKGVPASLKHGQTVYLTMYYRQRSRDIMVPESFGLGLWNMKAPAEGQLRGISVTWWDPVTHRWEKASYYDQTGWIGFYLPDSPQLRVASGTLAHVYVRITFSRAAFAGVWHFEPQVSSYVLFTAKGVGDRAGLDDISRKQYASTLS